MRVKNFIFVPFLFFKLDPATFKDICNNWRKYIWSEYNFSFFFFFCERNFKLQELLQEKFFFFSKNYFALFSFPKYCILFKEYYLIKKSKFPGVIVFNVSLLYFHLYFIRNIYKIKIGENDQFQDFSKLFFIPNFIFPRSI